MRTANQVRADFDGIAELEAGGGGWNHNRHYHGFILGQLPATFDCAMEIGCGSGELARAIAVRARRVLAVDVSQKMIDRALAHVSESSNIQYLVQDAGNWQWPSEQFDVIVSVAALHHLPLAHMLAKCTGALRPGGTLVVLDLYRIDTFADFVTCAIAFPVNRIMQWWSPPSRELQEAFTLHGQHDRYMTLAEVRKAATEAGLTGWRIRRHLFFRYSLIWVK